MKDPIVYIGSSASAYDSNRKPAAGFANHSATEPSVTRGRLRGVLGKLEEVIRNTCEGASAGSTGLLTAAPMHSGVCNSPVVLPSGEPRPAERAASVTPAPCGVPELGHRCWPGFLRGPLVFVDEAAENGPALNLRVPKCVLNARRA